MLRGNLTFICWLPLSIFLCFTLNSKSVQMNRKGEFRKKNVKNLTWKHKINNKIGMDNTDKDKIVII